MKFYYNGKLVRSSKTREYKYAVVRETADGKIVVWGCSSTREGAEKMYRDMYARLSWSKDEECIAKCKAYKIVALESK